VISWFQNLLSNAGCTATLRQVELYPNEIKRQELDIIVKGLRQKGLDYLVGRIQVESSAPIAPESTRFQPARAHEVISWFQSARFQMRLVHLQPVGSG
jgi:hypothetical protein